MNTRTPPQEASWPVGTIFTLGHSTLSIEAFIALLQTYRIQRLVDVRTIPASRHNPQYMSNALAASLAANGIGYLHMPALGGLRHPRKDSPNAGWQNKSFRGYADYMQTDAFREAVENALGVRGVPVVEILSASDWRMHALTPFAQVEDTSITYSPEQGSLL